MPGYWGMIWLMHIIKKIKRGVFIIGLLLVISFSLIAYYLLVLLPEQKKVSQDLNSLKEEITRLQSQMNEKSKLTDDKKVYSDCDQEAEKKARELLAKKIELGKTTGQYNVQEYQKAYNLGLRLKDDYNSYYDDCLRRNGIKY